MSIGSISNYTAIGISWGRDSKANFHHLISQFASNKLSVLTIISWYC